MKEDKTDKWIASSLKKHLEEGELPYELGAWENFRKKRKAKKRRAVVYWSSAVAASLLLLFAVSQVFLGPRDVQLEQVKVPLLADADQEVDPLNSNEISSSEKSEEKELLQKTKILEVIPSELLAETSKSPNISQKEVEKISNFNESLSKTSDLEAIAKIEEKQVSNTFSNKKTIGKVILEEEKMGQEKPINASGLIASQESVKLDLNNSEKKAGDGKSISEGIALSVKEEDFPEIPKNQTKVSFGMGFSPGFGAFQEDNLNTTASSIGVGMLLDLDLPGKLSIGSGFGFNYMNQQNESQLPITIAGYQTSQIEKQDIQQVQLEIPVYFKYPITRNNSVSVQAGFSNFYAINQNAEQQTTVNQQFAVNNTSDATSSFTLASKSVSETQVLTNDDSKFYPFATVNFGVNIKLVESKKVDYMVMPFYNHQLRSISGFGESFGMFGASLKLNFGGPGK